MQKSIPAVVLISIVLTGMLSGCGLIGGAFTLPEDDPNYTPAVTAAAGLNGNAGSAAAVNTPLPLQSVTPLPTGVPQLPPGCLDASAVTLDDYGKFLCVGGTITRINMTHGTYYVYFGERGRMYMMGPDWVDRIGLKAGECAYAEGKLSRDGVSPVMPITPFSLKRCPVAQPAAAPARPANLPANCAHALEVTRDDVGLERCVGGSVAFSEWEGNAYKIYFFTDKTLGLHLVSTKWTGRGVNSGDCIYVAEETIGLEESTNTPILNVVPGNVTFCPS
ncbi:MAG: hypothetical protein JW748_08810 [Anaerolineales bacterium]|nr:hypothetical protein [Anaerolineales bacterium]